MKCELWFCPKSAEIEDHFHKHIASNIIVLFGNLWGHIEKRHGLVPKFKRFSVPPGVVHGAWVGAHGPCIFLNFEIWDPAVPMTSAADDFNLPL